MDRRFRRKSRCCRCLGSEVEWFVLIGSLFVCLLGVGVRVRGLGEGGGWVVGRWSLGGFSVVFRVFFVFVRSCFVFSFFGFSWIILS